MITDLLAMLSSITPETLVSFELGAYATCTIAMVVAAWRAATVFNRFKHTLERLEKSSWTVDDHRLWAIKLERESRVRGSRVFVPDVEKS